MKTLLCGLVLFTCVFAHTNLTNYYENLIKKSISDSMSYRLPTDKSEYIPYTKEIKDIEDYDFIIVGSGTAGSILANRLSEINAWKILVLEAGTYPNNFTDIPGMSIYALKSKYNWGFKSIRQTKACLGKLGRKTLVPEGKGFGGTTIINGLRYVRGNKEDFLQWTNEGNRGWSYEEVLPYFKKSENSSIENADPGYHGHSGPIHVQYYKSPIPHMDAILEANEELGYKNVDYNGKSQLGISKAQLIENRGRRISTSEAFIKPILNRRNVVLIGDALVTKILINPDSKVAYGVVFSNDGRLFRVKARKEVILSAGTIGSPQMLMLSGVGPQALLKKLRIDVIKDLAVGRNLIDHPTFRGVWINTNLTTSAKTMREYIQEYLHGHGLYTNAVGLQGLGFYRSKHANISGVADLVMDYLPPNPAIKETEEITGYRHTTFKAIDSAINHNSSIQISIVCINPKSRGFVTLRGRGPYGYPLINLNLLSDPDNHDINVIYEGTKIIMKLLNTTALRRIDAKLAKIELPECKKFEYLSQRFWECTIRHLTSSGYHLTGTCKMGANPNNGAVVDDRLRVHGIQNLRVVDASVIPSTSGYPVAATMMVAEKASDIIKQDHGVLTQS